MKFQLLQLFKLLEKKRKKQFFLMLGLAVLSSFAEVLTLSSVIPFIGIITQPEKVFRYLESKELIQIFQFSNSSDLILPLTVGFAMAALLAACLRLMLSWITLQFANGVGSDLSIEVYRRALYQDYLVHVDTNSSEIISGITQKVGTASGVLLSLVQVITSAMLFISIFATLLVIDPLVASIAFIMFGVSYSLIAIKTRKRLMENSSHIVREQSGVIKALQEGLGGIRDILLDGTQNKHTNIYRKTVVLLEKASVENNFISFAPRFLMEALGMILIAGLAYYLSLREGGIGSALPMLGCLALGAQRLLPLMHLFYGSWSGLVGGRESLEIVFKMMNQPLPNLSDETSEKFYFKQSINLATVSFRYSEKSPWVLRAASLNIPKGSRIGFVGNTGSGKSTTLDIIMGLLMPTEGKIRIDNEVLSTENRRAWQKLIAHVPQNVFLTDGTIAENIAFGIPSGLIDMELVKQAAAKAQLIEFIASRAEGFSLIVGERGVRLSGGQRQRIGIARALYKQATVLVFDEATSALDNDTENSIMNAIENLNRDLTILIIAHRVSTLKNCDTIVQVENGKFTRI